MDFYIKSNGGGIKEMDGGVFNNGIDQEQN